MEARGVLNLEKLSLRMITQETVGKTVQFMDNLKRVCAGQKHRYTRWGTVLNRKSRHLLHHKRRKKGYLLLQDLDGEKKMGKRYKGVG